MFEPKPQHHFAMKGILLALFTAFLLVACTSDPMKGGFFFDEAAAYKRLDDKRAYLNDLQREQSSLRSSL
jgi:hypothetical protein